ncbi:MAG: pirin family protein [Saprospiraceae bacterium]|jgi:redox-sensitive bicupin YhaK (pirin superfamily)|uniref:pirin family protein n=1 Tax=Candidatus Brachybacter algidus TaxID=2982024 RepID=UPI001B5332E5|nr:pirin family protein [Candidatus Brachybacter algidus]MBP7304775.1 pirin family protein [Saprospiraceae bacterium]MBP9705321.1 pirin family protein [Chitinophagales bacterium]MBK6449882.1 pirin family protein [Candidatus Brachybacter algidus]MBK8356456.1 pirin family protein [Candidatus Brachybacter algidus]MBK8604453.1 pirin family protein [Candidatus Brachybacter algidus]
MSNIKLIIEERAVNIGNFMVGRLLPFRQKRMVGPFIYIDHMGPVKMNERENFDVQPHPHIGLSTLTFLLEGSIMHRDTLGNEVEIKPDAVNWMTAGKGIVHSERTPEYLRNSPLNMHGFQIWVALPKHLEQMEPAFFHIGHEQIPTWTDGDLQFKLVAGEAFGRKSPVPVFSKLYMLEIKSKTKRTVNIGDQLYGESGLYILEGTIENEGNIYEPNQLLVAKDSTLCEFTINENSTIYIFGGEPFPEERFIDWNFVSSSKELIKDAKQKWEAQEFPKIEGDETEYIPYPTYKRN